MSATQLFFNGRLTPRPGAYSKVDASAFNTAGLGASGIVALLGTAIGGKPYTAVSVPRDDLQRATNTGQVRRTFREGDLLEMAFPLFQPAKDPEIPAGAQQIVFVKVNPATQSQADFANGAGNALRLKSRDYGAFTRQIKVTIANATSGPGKLVTIDFEDDQEVFDLLGDTAKFTLTYNGGSDGATAARVNTLSTGMNVEFDRADVGQDTGVTQAPGASSLEVVSGNAGDTTQTATVYGLNATNVPTVASVTLNGTTAVAVPGTWNLVTGIVLSAVAAGQVDLQIASGGADVVVLTTGQTNKGRVALDITVVGALAVAADGATTRKLVYRGLTAAGAALAEVVTLSGTTPVALAGAFAKLTSVEVLNVEAARTATITGYMVNAAVSSYPNLQKLKDLIGANPDFTFVSLIGNAKDFLVADLDYVTDTNVYTVTASFYAQLFDIITELDNKSEIVEAERLTPGTGAPSNTSGSVFLAGGHEGDSGNPGVPTALSGDWQAALDLLKQVFVNTIVPATDDASVHAAVVAHCEFMGGQGKMERDCVVGAAANETKAQLKARILALNTRHARLVGQEVSLYNTAGERAWQAPKFYAAIVAGMQAGTSVGNPLTGKFANVLGVRQHSGWNPVDDGDELLLAGLHFLQLEEGKGFKVVRNLTTYLIDENLTYIEASMNQAVNFAVYNLRSRMESIVGKKGFARTINAAKAAADGTLEGLVREEIIAAYGKPAFELSLDVLRMDVEIAVISPINFVPVTVNLKPLSITA